MGLNLVFHRSSVTALMLRRSHCIWTVFTMVLNGCNKFKNQSEILIKVGVVKYLTYGICITLAFFCSITSASALGALWPPQLPPLVGERDLMASRVETSIPGRDRGGIAIKLLTHGFSIAVRRGGGQGRIALSSMVDRTCGRSV